MRVDLPFCLPTQEGAWLACDPGLGTLSLTTRLRTPPSPGSQGQAGPPRPDRAG